uniref:Uncharacterized protein n=1 Tax=Helianthus annuus TaxID=4232 RepID=A0A251S020_HELAN
MINGFWLYHKTTRRTEVTKKKQSETTSAAPPSGFSHQRRILPLRRLLPTPLIAADIGSFLSADCYQQPSLCFFIRLSS